MFLLYSVNMRNIDKLISAICPLATACMYIGISSFSFAIKFYGDGQFNDSVLNNYVTSTGTLCVHIYIYILI